MIGRMLASLGIGSAKVDTILSKSTYYQGELVKGDILIEGGKTKQRIDSIYLYLAAQSLLDEQQGERLLDQFLLTESFVIEANERKRIPFQFTLPVDTPVSAGGVTVYLKTGLDVKRAVDPDDLDGIEVTPHPAVDAIIRAFRRLHFHLSEINFDREDYSFKQKYYFQGERQLICSFQVQPSEIDVQIDSPEGKSLGRFTLLVEQCKESSALENLLKSQLEKVLG